MKKLILFSTLIISGFLFTWVFNKETGSSGSLDGFIYLFLCIIYLTLFFLILYLIPKRIYTFYLILITLFFLIINILFQQGLFKSKTIIFARLRYQDIINQDSSKCDKLNTDINFEINFRENKTCLLKEIRLDYSFANSFNYTLTNDTIKIDSDIIAKSKNVLASEYYIDKKDSTLRPVSQGKNIYPFLKFILFEK